MAPTNTDSSHVVVEHHGSIAVVQPLTGAAREWIDEHVAADALWWGGGLVVEPRYLDNLLAGMRHDLTAPDA